MLFQRDLHIKKSNEFFETENALSEEKYRIFKNCRPISLLNVYYKIATKTIALGEDLVELHSSLPIRLC